MDGGFNRSSLWKIRPGSGSRAATALPGAAVTQLGAQVIGQGVADDPAGGDAGHDGQVQPAFPGADVGDVAAPAGVDLRGVGGEVPADLVCTGGRGRHAVLLPGNIYGTACALDGEGPHAKAVAPHGFMLRPPVIAACGVASNVHRPWGRSENVFFPCTRATTLPSCPGPRRRVFKFLRTETGMDAIFRSTDFIRA